MNVKALHTWVLFASIVLGVVGESGVITSDAWRKLVVGLAGAVGALAVRMAAAWTAPEPAKLPIPGGDR